MSSLVKAELEAEEGSLSICLVEVATIVKQVCGGKAPVIDEIRPEMVKAMGVHGLFWNKGLQGSSLGPSNPYMPRV